MNYYMSQSIWDKEVRRARDLLETVIRGIHSDQPLLFGRRPCVGYSAWHLMGLRNGNDLMQRAAEFLKDKYAKHHWSDPVL